jgi:hypothetical protein
MYSGKFGIHGMIAAIVAFAILGISVLVMDQGYLFSAPAGVVQVEKPAPIEALDEVDVVGTR